MSTQQSLRLRIRSAQNIKHITQAMEVVAGVRFRKLMNKMEHFRVYSDKFTELVDQLKSGVGVDEHILFKKRPTQNIGVVVVSGDKGLCGSYNDKLLKEAEKFLKTLPTGQVELILLGNKAVDYFKNKQWKIKRKQPDFTRNLSEGIVRQWSIEYTKSFEKGEYDELWIVYTHYINVLAREVQIEKILPLDVEATSSSKAKPSLDFIFEPNPATIYHYMIPFFFYAKLHSHLYESYASELSSRMIAMKAATKNAEEVIDKLTLIKNKQRQLNITKEILEITAGAEGIK